MKKNLTLLILTILFFGCNDNLEIKTNEINKSDLIGADNAKQMLYAEQNLTVLGQAIMPLSTNPEFRKILYDEIENKFDGETNVLIKNLVNPDANVERHKIIYNSLLKVTGSVKKVKETLQAFDGIANRNYYPQIFIPFYDQLRDNGIVGTGDPILVINVEDKPVYSAYKLNSNGELIHSDLKIDEDYANSHEVWVISINERVDDSGNVLEEFTEGNLSARIQGESYPNARWNVMRITSYKESWASGASEINCKRWLSFYRWDQYSASLHAKGLTAEDTPEDGDGRHIRDFSRKDVKNDRDITVNWVYVPDWPNQVGNVGGTYFHTDYLYYVIFEYDPWPTGFRSFNLFDAAGITDFRVCYRSADDYYHTGNIPEWIANGYLIDGGGIRTNSQY